MKIQTELAIRSIAGTDAEITPDNLEKALRVLRGIPDSTDDLIHVLRRKEVEELLHVHRRTIDYYLDNGYLDRVYGGGKRAIGISRESFIRFTTRRVAIGSGLCTGKKKGMKNGNK